MIVFETSFAYHIIEIYNSILFFLLFLMTAGEVIVFRKSLGNRFLFYIASVGIVFLSAAVTFANLYLMFILSAAVTVAAIYKFMLVIEASKKDLELHQSELMKDAYLVSGLLGRKNTDPKKQKINISGDTGVSSFSYILANEALSINGVMIIDFDGHIITCNDAFSNYLGLPKEEIINRNYRVFLAGDQELVAEETWNKNKQGKTSAYNIINYWTVNGIKIKMHWLKCKNDFEREVAFCILNTNFVEEKQT